MKKNERKMHKKIHDSKLREKKIHLELNCKQPALCLEMKEGVFVQIITILSNKGVKKNISPSVK